MVQLELNTQHCKTSWQLACLFTATAHPLTTNSLSSYFPHPGNDADSRDDDRLSVRIQFKSVKAQGGGAKVDQIDADVDTIDVSNIQFVTLLQEDSCEEEPDTDVLSEETLPVTDPEIDDLSELATDP